jgi:hypothetical protein
VVKVLLEILEESGFERGSVSQLNGTSMVGKGAVAAPPPGAAQPPFGAMDLSSLRPSSFDRQ